MGLIIQLVREGQNVSDEGELYNYYELLCTLKVWMYIYIMSMCYFIIFFTTSVPLRLEML